MIARYWSADGVRSIVSGEVNKMTAAIALIFGVFCFILSAAVAPGGAETLRVAYRMVA